MCARSHISRIVLLILASPTWTHAVRLGLLRVSPNAQQTPFDHDVRSEKVLTETKATSELGSPRRVLQEPQITFRDLFGLYNGMGPGGHGLSFSMSFSMSMPVFPAPTSAPSKHTNGNSTTAPNVIRPPVHAPSAVSPAVSPTTSSPTTSTSSPHAGPTAGQPTGTKAPSAVAVSSPTAAPTGDNVSTGSLPASVNRVSSNGAAKGRNPSQTALIVVLTVAALATVAALVAKKFHDKKGKEVSVVTSPENESL